MTVATTAKLWPWQKRIIVIAWLTYATYYLGRVNLSTALPDLQSSLALTRSQVGLISTGYFLGYALGQLINGQLGDRISPRRFIALGLLASAGLNLLFGFTSTLPLLIGLWALNGYFQATGWGPTLRVLSNWLTPVQRARVSGVFGTSFVVGNAVSWLLSGWLTAHYGWRTAFWVPGMLLALVAAGWFYAARDTPEAAGHPPVSPEVGLTRLPMASGLLRNLIHSLRRLWPLVAASICLGFTFAALLIWLPTYYVDVGRLGIEAAAGYSTLLPIAGIIGTVLVAIFLAHYGIGREPLLLALSLVLLAGLFLAYPWLNLGAVGGEPVLLLIGALVYAATSVLLTTMPLVLGGRAEASATAGLLDLSFNIGASITGGVVGLLLERTNWNLVFMTLGTSVLISAGFLLVAQRQGVMR